MEKRTCKLVRGQYNKYSIHFFVINCLVKSGRITAEILQETLRAFNIHAMTVYICGPPPMIKFVSTTLESAGLDKGNIKLEQWW